MATRTALRSTIPSLLRPAHLQATRNTIIPLQTQTKIQTRSMSKIQSDVGKAKGFLDQLAARRTHYALSNEAVIPDAQVENIVTEALYHVPSSFNSQSTRILLLFREQHEKLWDITTETLKAIVPAEQFEATSKKMGAFRGGHGTVLFFEDQEVITGLQEKMAIYADKFPQWSEHTSAMHQLAIWTALQQNGYGSNLQHYNPLIDERVQKEWGVSPQWKLTGQLVFGKIEAEPKEKTFEPIEKRLKVAGKQ